MGDLRIIAGKWRSRKIPVLEGVAGLRPTPDRVRETVFNWLTPHIVGARCLDLFAGTGIMGFEALSRGASHVVMVDVSSKVTNHLAKMAQLLGAKDLEIQQSDALQWLQQELQNYPPFDIIFLDPPFHQNWVEKLMPAITVGKVIEKTGYIYIEIEKETKEVPLPKNYKLMKHKIAGAVSYNLASGSMESG